MVENDDDAKLTVLQAIRRALVIPKSDYSPHRSSTTPTCHPLCSINVSFATVHPPFAARLFRSRLCFHIVGWQLLPEHLALFRLTGVMDCQLRWKFLGIYFKILFFENERNLRINYFHNFHNFKWLRIYNSLYSFKLS